MSFKSLVITLFAVSLIFSNCFAGEVCFSKEESKKLLSELVENKANKEIIKTQEELLENIKKQNKLLEENVKLLQEQVQIMKGQIEILKVAYEEERKKANLSLVEKGKLFGIGVMAGALLMFIFGM